MFRRLFWLVVGAGFGFGVSFWVMRSIRGAVDRYRPERVTSNVQSAVSSFGADLRSAAADGRVAMHEREAQLRAEIYRS
ncbi:MAG TPA: hypothetical protein VGH94_01685 [Acidimicrobiales bacterium]